MDSSSNLTSVQDSPITQDLLETVVREYEKCEEVVVWNFTVRPGSSHGDNFTSIMYAVDMEAGKKGETQKTYHFMVKCFPQNELRREWLLKSKLFPKEIQVYQKLIPLMIEMQETRNVEPLIPATVQCYYARSDGLNDIIFMENMKHQGYKMADVRKGLGYEECKLVMQEIAKFHALSFGMKRDYGEDLSKQFDFLEEAVYKEGMLEELAFFENVYDGAIDIIKSSGLTNFASRMEKFKGKVFKTLMEKTKITVPFQVICHGDCWCNNMVFCYEKQGDTEIPTAVKLIDLQIIRYASPMLDLAYFLYTSTTPTLRKNHLNDLLQLYYDCFLSCLKHVGDEAPGYTFEKLQMAFKSVMLFGFFSACFILLTVAGKAEDIPDMESISKENLESLVEGMKSNMTNHCTDTVRERLVGVVEEMAEQGLI